MSSVRVSRCCQWVLVSVGVDVEYWCQWVLSVGVRGVGVECWCQ